MLRENNVCCGIASSGAGALTLAACPASQGGIDPFVAFGGMGLGTANPTAMPYTLIEFTDSTFATIKQRERGLGYLKLGASIGATTLTRTSPTQTQVIATSASTRGTIQAPVTPITIGVAANTLLFIGPEVDDLAPALPGYNSLNSAVAGSGGYSGNGALGWSPSSFFTATFGSLLSGAIQYSIIKFEIADFVKTVSVHFAVTLTSPTTFSLAIALYTLSPVTFLPDRMLVNFGSTPTPPTTGVFNSYTAAVGAFVTPGYYALAMLPIWTGGSGSFGPRQLPAYYSSPWGVGAGMTSAIFTLQQPGQTSLVDPASSATVFNSNSNMAPFTPACAFRNT